MNAQKYVSVFGLLSALVFCFTKIPANAGPGKNETSHSNKKLDAQASAKGRATTNAQQWSADPERGWVRADERHKLQQRDQKAEKSAGGTIKRDGSKNSKSASY